MNNQFYSNITSNKEVEYSFAVQSAYNKSLLEKSKLSDWILNMEGMSGVKFRHFINNLISQISNPRYLEIGAWTGSTFCSAINRNRVNAYCIDNWSQFSGPKEIFFNNLNLCLSEMHSIDSESSSIIVNEKDFREVVYSDIGKYNIYFFDGPHEEQDQYDGVTFAYPALDNTFIFICDDWNWTGPQNGTIRAFKDLQIETIFSIEIKTTLDKIYPSSDRQNSDWHNGYFIAVCKKKDV